MSNFYTDEPIDWMSPDMSDGNGMYMPEGTDSIHNWEYLEPEPEDDAGSWQSGYGVADSVDTPEKIRQLLELIHRQPWEITRAKSFYEQALFMADYSDDAEIVTYMNYFPTYRDMTVAQMRSYFTIRKMWRQGKFPEVSLSYIFVYIYEILMQTGVGSPEDGYEILRELQSAYSASEPKLARYLVPWLKDYVVYYNLQDRFREQFAVENDGDATAAVLADYAKADGKSLLEAVCSLSRYDIRRSTLFRKQPQKACDCTVAVLRAIIPRLEQAMHHHIETLCLGKKAKRQTAMFGNAVFYDPEPVKNAEIYVSPRHRYICRGGLWSKDEYIVNALHVRKSIGALLHEVDSQLRVVLGVKPLLKSGITDVPLREAIHAAVASWAEQERKEELERDAERRRVSIDFSKLGRIRSDAEVVQDKLLEGSDEAEEADKEESADDVGQINQLTPTGPVAQVRSGSRALSPETAFLRIFLSGGDWKQYLRDNHIPEGVMVENINSKAMDDIGDIVLDDDGGGLHLIEDYRENVERMMEADHAS